jgi:hypothetical protein
VLHFTQFLCLRVLYDKLGRSQWSRGLRHVLSSTSRTLGSRFEFRSSHICVSPFLCIVIYYVGKGLVSGWSPSKESYQMSKEIHKFQKLNSESEVAMMAYLEVNDGKLFYTAQSGLLSSECSTGCKWRIYSYATSLRIRNILCMLLNFRKRNPKSLTILLLQTRWTDLPCCNV